MSQHRVSCEVLDFDPAIVGRLSPEAKERLKHEPDQGRRIVRAIRRAWSAALTPVQRSYMQEYYVNCKTMRQIAEEYGVNIGTVSRTLSRARNRLRYTLKFYL